MRDKNLYHVTAGNKKSPNNVLHGAELEAATNLNLLITAALTRSCLQALSELSPWPEPLSNLVIPVMGELMQSALLGMAPNHIPSFFDPQKTLNFTFTGSLKILSDDDAVIVGLVDTELQVKSDGYDDESDD